MIRLGLIGLGAMGLRHLDALLTRADVQLVAIADPRADAIAEAIARIVASAAASPESFSDGVALVETARVDAVVVATPPATHTALCCPAIAAGIAVLVEKPLASSVAEARSIVDRAQSSPVIVQVGHIERFNPAFAALEACLHDDLVGRVTSIQAVRLGTATARRDDVGVTFDLAIHDLDLICHLLGEAPRSVDAHVERAPASIHEDVVRGQLTFSSGVAAAVEASWRGTDRERDITIVGVRGTLEADLLNRDLWLQAADAPGRRRIHVPPGEPLQREHDAFVAAIQSRGVSAVTAEDGWRAVALAQLTLDSAAAGHSLDYQSR